MTTLPPLPPTDPKIMAIQPVETMPNGERIHWPMEYHIGFKDARRAAAVVAAAERASLLAVLRQVGEAMQVSMIYVGGEGSDEELSAHQDALAALNEALKEQL